MERLQNKMEPSSPPAKKQYITNQQQIDVMTYIQDIIIKKDPGITEAIFKMDNKCYRIKWALNEDEHFTDFQTENLDDNCNDAISIRS